VSELEHALVALGHELAVPETPDFVPRVLTALEPPARPARMRLAVVLVAVLVAVLLAALAIPDARSALARFFHIGANPPISPIPASPASTIPPRCPSNRLQIQP